MKLYLTIAIVAAALCGLLLFPCALFAGEPGQAGGQLDQFSGLAAFLAAAALGLGMAYGIKDDTLKNSKTLPSGAATVQDAGFDLGHGSRGDFLANCELQIEAPLLATGELGDGATMIYHVYHSDNSDYSSEELLCGNVLTQTGAGGAGAAAATKQVRLPVDVKRYVRCKAVNSAAVDASAKSFVSRLVF